MVAFGTSARVSLFLPLAQPWLPPTLLPLRRHLFPEGQGRGRRRKVLPFVFALPDGKLQRIWDFPSFLAIIAQ